MKPRVQTACICFKSSRLWVSSAQGATALALRRCAVRYWHRRAYGIIIGKCACRRFELSFISAPIGFHLFENHD